MLPFHSGNSKNFKGPLDHVYYMNNKKIFIDDITQIIQRYHPVLINQKTSNIHFPQFVCDELCQDILKVYCLQDIVFNGHNGE